MKIEMRSTDSIRPYEQNPRLNDAAVEAVARSLREFGWRQPIVVDVHDTIVVGHTRYRAALKNGMTEVPVHVATELTEAQARAYRIADNQTATIAEWNLDLLPAELQGLADTDFDLSLLGFDPEELAGLLAPAPTEGLVDPDDVPPVPKIAVTQPGDLYVLGRHRLLCGDATRAEDVAKLMAGASADLWLTDPPFNVSYQGKTRDALTIQNDCMPDAEFRAFLKSAFDCAFTAIKPGASFYIFHADSEGYNFRGAVFDLGQRVRQCLIWKKQTLVMGRQDFHWIHEPILYGWKDGASHHWFGDRKQVTVLEYDRPAASPDHPTTKPVELFAYLILQSCPPNGIVLDTFCGSGTTLIACEQLGRTCYAMELDPVYCDVIVKRWEQYTGQKAERITAGSTSEKAPAVKAGAKRGAA